MNDERPRVGQTWVNVGSGIRWQCISADPVVFVDGMGRRRRPRPLTLAKAWRRVVL